MPTLVRNKNNLEEVKYIKSRSEDINLYFKFFTRFWEI